MSVEMLLNADDFRIRPACSNEYEVLNFIKMDASLMLGKKYSRPIKPDLFFECISRGDVLTATINGDIPCAYSMAYEAGNNLYLRHLYVRRDYNHKGLGTFLLKRVIERAKNIKKSAITLTTSGSAPWNAPFYSRYGFVVVSERMPDYLQQALEDEKRDFGSEDFSPEYPYLLPRVAMERRVR